MKTTLFHDAHIALGAKTGAFAGYDMPLYYADGVLKEHDWTRTQASLFDVSHMGQVMVTGPGAAGFWHRVTPGGFNTIPDGRAKYTVLLNEAGGIIDDLIVTRLGVERFFAVINAGCKDKDIAWLRDHLPADAHMDVIRDRALIALQGPESESALRAAAGIDMAGIPYMWAVETDGLLVSRLGYTGEDGFEISLPSDRAVAVWDALLRQPSVRPAGLAARDGLRLEMGYPLYGHDIDDTTSPVEAGLEWIIAKDRRDYIGAAIVTNQLGGGAARRRVGLTLLDKGIAREGAGIFDAAGGRKIGTVTSGGFSPTLKQAIAQGYVETACAAPGTEVFINVRGTDIRAAVTAMPFVPAKTRPMKKK